jgi:hypothetical protein
VENFIIDVAVEPGSAVSLSGVVIAGVGIMEKTRLSRFSFISTAAVP